jgi:hypothetical protein
MLAKDVQVGDRMGAETVTGVAEVQEEDLFGPITQTAITTPTRTQHLPPRPVGHRPPRGPAVLTTVEATEVQTGDLLYGNADLEVTSVRVYELRPDSDGSPVTDVLIVTRGGETHEFDGRADVPVRRR